MKLPTGKAARFPHRTDKTGKSVCHWKLMGKAVFIEFNSDTARWRGQPLRSRPPPASHLLAPPRPEVGLDRSSVGRRPRRRLNRSLWRRHHSYRRMRWKMSTPISLRVLMEFPILFLKPCGTSCSGSAPDLNWFSSSDRKLHVLYCNIFKKII